MLDEQAYLRARDPTAGAVLATEGHRTWRAQLFADPSIYERLFPGNIYSAGGYLWLATQHNNGTLWRATGEPGSAVPVMAFDGEPRALPAVITLGARVLATDGLHLYAIEPTSLSRTRLASNVQTSPVLAPEGGHAWFLSGQELWRTDGTTNDTARVAEGFAQLDRQRSVVVAGPAVFGRDAQTHALVAWNENVGRVGIDGFPPNADMHLVLAEAFVGVHAFITDDRERRYGLLRVDAHTLEVGTLGELALDYPPRLSSDGTGGAWVHSSTTGGGPRLWRLGPDGRPAQGFELTNRGGVQPFDVAPPPRLYTEDLHGITASGTLFVGRLSDLSIVDVATGSVAQSWELAWPYSVSVDPGGAFYALSDQQGGSELWRYEDETGTPRRLGAWPRQIGGLEPTGGGLYFFTTSGQLGDDELWWTDGTPQGTQRVDLGLGNGQGLSVFEPVVAPLEAWVHGEGHRWVQETSQGPQTLLEIAELPASRWRRFVRAGAARYSITVDGDPPPGERRVQVHRLRPAPTTPPIELVYESSPSGNGASCGFQMPSEARLLSAGEGLYTFGSALLKLDEAGVRGVRAPCRVQESLPFGAGALFTVFTENEGLELWIWQPELPLRLVKDIAPGPASSRPTALTAAGAREVFYAWHPGLGRELLVTDGTEAGTYPVTDLVPGPRDGVHRRAQITVGPEHVVFFGLDRAHGAEPWRLGLAELDTRIEIPALPEPAGPLAPAPGGLKIQGCGCRTEPTNAGFDGLWLGLLCVWLCRRRCVAWLVTHT